MTWPLLTSQHVNLFKLYLFFFPSFSITVPGLFHAFVVATPNTFAGNPCSRYKREQPVGMWGIQQALYSLWSNSPST